MGFKLLRTLENVLRKVPLQCKSFVSWIEVDVVRAERMLYGVQYVWRSQLTVEKEVHYSDIMPEASSSFSETAKCACIGSFMGSYHINRLSP